MRVSLCACRAVADLSYPPTPCFEHLSPITSPRTYGHTHVPAPSTRTSHPLQMSSHGLTAALLHAHDLDMQHHADTRYAAHIAARMMPHDGTHVQHRTLEWDDAS